MKLDALMKSYLFDACPKSRYGRNFVVIFRGQDTTYAADLSTALRQAILLSFSQLRKTGRFFPVYVKENRTSRIIYRLELRDKVLELAGRYFGLQPKRQNQESFAGRTILKVV